MGEEHPWVQLRYEALSVQNSQSSIPCLLLRRIALLRDESQEDHAEMSTGCYNSNCSSRA